MYISCIYGTGTMWTFIYKENVISAWAIARKYHLDFYCFFTILW